MDECSPFLWMGRSRRLRSLKPPSDVHSNYTGPVPSFFSVHVTSGPRGGAAAVAEGLMLQRPWFTDKADDKLRSHPASSLRGLF